MMSLKKPCCALAMALAATVGLGTAAWAPPAAMAGTITLGSSADTQIEKHYNPDENYGTADGVWIKQTGDDNTRHTEGYFRFDLSPSTDVPEMATITGAILKFYQMSGDNIVSGRFSLYGLNSVAGATPQDWGETTLTYNNAGIDRDLPLLTSLTAVTRLDTGTGANLDISGDSSDTRTVTVSGTPISDWLSTRLQYGGLATFIVDFPAQNTSRDYTLGSRESNYWYTPQLFLQYTPGTPPPPPVTWTPGDANMDGVVDGLDLQLIANNWQGTGATWSQGDFNDDGSVNGLDLQLLANNWQHGVTGSALPTFAQAESQVQFTAVPEPTSAALLLATLAALGLGLRIRPRRDLA